MTTKPLNYTRVYKKYFAVLANRVGLFSLDTDNNEYSAYSAGTGDYIQPFCFGLVPAVVREIFANFGLNKERAVITNMVHQLEFVNDQTCDIYVKLHWTTPRHDYYDIDGTAYDFRDTNDLIMDALADAAGYTPAVGKLCDIDPCISLWNLDRFLSVYKVKSTKSFKLKPGQSVKLVNRVRRTIYSNGYYVANPYLIGYAWKTLIPVLEVRGDLAHSSGDTDINRAAIGIANALLGCVYTVSAQVYQINEQKTTLSVDNNLANLGATPVTMQMSNPSDTALL